MMAVHNGSGSAPYMLCRREKMMNNDGRGQHAMMARVLVEAMEAAARATSDMLP